MNAGFILAALLAAAPLPAQSLPSLVEIRQLPGPYGGSSAGAPHMAASPGRRAFVVYGQGVEENPSGLFNAFAVIAPDGRVHGANAFVPARVATVADDGTAFALGPRSASDPRIILSKIGPAGDVPWSYTIDGCSAAMAVA